MKRRLGPVLVADWERINVYEKDFRWKVFDWDEREEGRFLVVV